MEAFVTAGHGIYVSTAPENTENALVRVFQDYQIYGATLAENVLMDEVEVGDRERILEALKQADFEKRLSRLPDGPDTNMTREFREDGTMLSGGEAQKVAIARMFVRTGKQFLAILDEPSSALDPLAEYQLNTNMMKNAGDAAVIFISHRLSTTRDADRFICLRMEGSSNREVIRN